jgi:hypothetical protein
MAWMMSLNKNNVSEKVMRYSATYPTGRERFIYGRVEVEKWRGEGGSWSSRMKMI